MQRIHSFSLLLLTAFIVFLSAGCDPDDCPDGFIAIDPADATGAEYSWRVTSLVNTPSGPISSIVLLDDFENVYNASDNALITVVLVAEDNESGIRTIDVSGGFGFSCQQDDNSIILGSGIFPSNPFSFGGNMGCAAPEGAYQVTQIDPSQLCSGPGSSFRDASYAFDGIITNGVETIDLTRLTIFVTPAGL